MNSYKQKKLLLTINNMAEKIFNKEQISVFLTNKPGNSTSQSTGSSSCSSASKKKAWKKRHNHKFTSSLISIITDYGYRLYIYKPIKDDPHWIIDASYSTQGEGGVYTIGRFDIIDAMLIRLRKVLIEAYKKGKYK